MFLYLTVVIVVLLIKEIFVLIQEQVKLLIILIDHLSFVVVVDFYAFILEVADDLLTSAEVVTQTQELNQILELVLDWKHLLGEVVYYFD